MEVTTNGRNLITNKSWGSRIFEIYIDEVSPSGDWIKISETDLDSKGKKKFSRWYKRSEIIFHEELNAISDEADESNVIGDIEEQLQ